MTFDPGTWWLVVGLLGLGGTALAFLLKRNMTESDRTKDRVTELEARSAQKSDVDKALEKDVYKRQNGCRHRRRPQ